MDEERALGALAVLEDDLAEATIELFESQGMPVSRDEDAPSNLAPDLDGELCLAVIGYAGEPVRGALSLMARHDAVRTWQTGFDAVDTSATQDMIGEFSNMLLGRLKYKLLTRGVTVLVATPSTASGTNLVLRPATGLVSRWFAFRGPGWPFYVRLDATFEPNFSFESEPVAESPAAAGDMMLF